MCITHAQAVSASPWTRPYSGVNTACFAGLQQLASGAAEDDRDEDTAKQDTPGRQRALQRRAAAAAAANRGVVAALGRGLLGADAPAEQGGLGAQDPNRNPAEAVGALVRAAGGAGRHVLLLALRAASGSGAKLRLPGVTVVP